ncbi:MAG TPA: CRISPR-associated endonuclease Cas1 [Anaerohalosphaeraceae bacterium]|jgi:CRISPR-associated protein Cas1|nr:CRISPR-associated endonuclease Cas1 [Anaerohalosphaeraceae bacterium]
MGSIYLQEQGSKVSRQGRRLIVTKDDQELLSIPSHRTDRLVIMGRIQLTASAMALLLDRQIPVVLTTQRGQIRGTLMPSLGPHTQVRRKQYTLAADPAFQWSFCRDLVKARAASAVNVIRRYGYNHPFLDLKSQIRQILDFSAQIEAQSSIDSLRGMEGMISREYFAALVVIFRHLKMNFEGRVRRPPSDPVNACLSYVYILLTALAENALQTTGLDPFCGLMHAPNRNAPALALDFVEQFRQPLADRFVMLLFNKRILQKSDFETGQGNLRPVLLKTAARKRLIAEWESFLHAPQRLIEKAQPLSPFQLIYQKAEHLEQAIRNGKPFPFYQLSL